MSLHRRESAVSAAEARAAACIAKARAKVAASRDQGESQVFPIAVVASGMLAGVVIERQVGRDPPRRARDRQDADSASSGIGPGWLSIANLGMAMRLWRELGPMLGAGAAGQASATAANAGEQAMNQGGGAEVPSPVHD